MTKKKETITPNGVEVRVGKLRIYQPDDFRKGTEPEYYLDGKRLENVHALTLRVGKNGEVNAIVEYEITDKV